MADPLDRAALDELRAMTGDDPVLYAELLDTFLSDAELYLGQLGSATDGETLTRAAHSLKSNAMSVGAVRLAELSRTLEADSRAGDVADADGRVADIGAELDTVRAAVLAEREAVTRGG